MKNTALITIIHVLGISAFILFVSLGITAQATMIGITILVCWAAISMFAIELRHSVLEIDFAATETRLAPVSGLVQMPLPVRSAA